MRPDLSNEIQGRILRKDSDVIDRLQRRHDLQAVRCGIHRPPPALDSPDRRVRIKAHHENISELFCFLKIGDVTGVEDVEATIRKDDFPAAPSEPLGNSPERAARLGLMVERGQVPRRPQKGREGQ